MSATFSSDTHTSSYKNYIKKFISQILDMNEDIRMNRITEKSQRIKILKHLKSLLSIVNSIEYRKILELQTMMKFDLINSVSYDDEADFDINLNDDGSGDDDSSDDDSDDDSSDDNDKKPINFNNFIKNEIKTNSTIKLDIKEKKKRTNSIDSKKTLTKDNTKQLTIDKWRLNNDDKTDGKTDGKTVSKIIEVNKLENTNCIYRNLKTAHIKKKLTRKKKSYYFKESDNYFYGKQCNN